MPQSYLFIYLSVPMLAPLFVHLFVYPCKKYLLSSYYMPGTTLGTWKAVPKRTDTSPVLKEIYILEIS